MYSTEGFYLEYITNSSESIRRDREMSKHSKKFTETLKAYKHDKSLILYIIRKMEVLKKLRYNFVFIELAKIKV